jgi:hypothetical protein
MYLLLLLVLFRLDSTECWREIYTWLTIQEETLPKNSAKKLKREEAAYNKLDAELAKELKPLLEENKEVSSWTVDISTCQLRQQEAKVKRKREKLNPNAD